MTTSSEYADYVTGEPVVDGKAPEGPVAERWDKRRFEAKLVNPANRRKHTVIVVGTGLAGGFESGKPYQNVVDTFSTWYGNVIYIVAVLALGLHIRHGFWSAAQTLGAGSRTRDRALRTTANILALVLTLGFVSVPLAVMTGVVS